MSESLAAVSAEPGPERTESPTLDRRSWHDVLRAGGANVYAAGASLLILILTSRALGPSGRGVYAAATAWVSFFATLGSLSLGQSVLHHVTQRRAEDTVVEVTGTLRALIAVIAVCSWLVASIAYAATGGRFFQHVPAPVLALAFLTLPFTLWFDNGRYLLFALGRVRAFNNSQVIGYTASVLLLVIVLFGFRLGLMGAIAAWVFLYLVLAALSYRSATVDSEAPRFSRALAAQLLGSGVKLHLNTISTFIHLQSSVLILNYFRSPEEVGFYQLATQVVSLGTLVPLGIAAVTYSEVASSGPDGAWMKQRRLVVIGLLAALVSFIVGYVFSPLAVRLLAGDAFVPSVPLIRILLLSLFGMSLSITMASQWIGRGLFWQTAVISTAVAVLSIGLDIALIPRFGMYGALYSTLAIYVTSLLVNGTFALRLESRYRRNRKVRG